MRVARGAKCIPSHWLPQQAAFPHPLSKAASPAWLHGLLIIVLCLVAFAGPAAAKELTFSAYDTPLYDQIVQRIRDHITDRLQSGGSRSDRYFMVPFAYQNRRNNPEFSHSFITVVRVLATGKQAAGDSELMTGSYRHWQFEAYNISWIPHDFLENPHLCVFHGFGARLFPSWNTCPLSEGKNFNLHDTIRIAANARVAVGMWGPYEVSKPGFDLGIKRKRLLDSGTIKYRADDRLYRKDQTAINCFHAMASLDEPFPNGGVLGTGFKMWGLNGTSRVLLEDSTKATNKGLLLEPVDIKKDRYGFVYSPSADSREIYNPFTRASAYRQ